MDLGFLATANNITGTYFDHTAAGRSSVSELNSDASSQFSNSLESKHKAAQVQEASSDNVRQDFVSNTNINPLSEHAARLGFSIDNRVFDMLGLQVTDSMNSMIQSAMNNAMDDMTRAM